MSNEAVTPVILLTFANDLDDPLRHLAGEARRLRKRIDQVPHPSQENHDTGITPLPPQLVVAHFHHQVIRRPDGIEDFQAGALAGALWAEHGVLRRLVVGLAGADQLVALEAVFGLVGYEG